MRISTATIRDGSSPTSARNSSVFVLFVIGIAPVGYAFELCENLYNRCP